MLYQRPPNIKLNWIQRFYRAKQEQFEEKKKVGGKQNNNNIINTFYGGYKNKKPGKVVL